MRIVLGGGHWSRCHYAQTASANAQHVPATTAAHKAQLYKNCISAASIAANIDVIFLLLHPLFLYSSARDMSTPYNELRAYAMTRKVSASDIDALIAWLTNYGDMPARLAPRGIAASYQQQRLTGGVCQGG